MRKFDDVNKRTWRIAAEAGIPEADRKQVVNYIGQGFRGLHVGNVSVTDRGLRILPGSCAGRLDE